jgi:predicted nuclease of restriction endonuclease-like (RecB) superfamily
MKNKKPTSIVPAKNDIAPIIDKELFARVREILDSARGKAFAAVNFAMVEAYWNVGREIIERQGSERAAYGDGLIAGLSKQLTEEYGKGFTLSNLKNIRRFYLAFQNHDALRHQLTWTHYRLIMTVENERARSYYLQESAAGNWSTRQLERQINSNCYERVLASRGDRDAAKNDVLAKEPAPTALDVIKDPYVLEFLGLQANTKYLEADIEQGLIDHMQKFLLELGRGFTFEARQKRITFDGRHFYIDLVFYNYILKCFVLIDVKAGDLTHQDLGQMQMYVNYYTRELMNEGDNPPIGIVLCAAKSESIVKYTFPEEGNPQIFTSKYKLHLPTEEELARELAAEQALLLREKSLKK